MPAAERVNGTREAVRTAVRTASIDLDGDYEGWRATMRVNPSTAVWEDLVSGDDDRHRQAIGSLVIDWNFVDDDGADLPLPKDGLNWSVAPFDLLVKLTNAYLAKVQERMAVPKGTSTVSEPTSPSGT